ncbi:MAG: trimeric autotransporter adhesin, partial [Mycobacterium sp.]|nr:trimeric autotransporter adhesin [Mycobacterium sp.]
MLNTSLVASVRRRTGVAAVTALALWSGLAVTIAQPAAANPIAAQTFSTPGTYTIAVPARAVAVTLIGVGAAGFAGDSSSTGLSTGGAGGSGTQVAETLPINSALDIRPGDTLTVVVGAKGGGGQRGGNGGNIGGNGGNGGGATYIRSPMALVLGAGGGGGGGGGGGAFSDEDGGTGGTSAAGTAGVESFGTAAGRGGSLGDSTCSGGTAQVSPGQKGETTSTFGNSGGGGGGGGEGFCGGGSGGSGDHGIGSQTGGSGGGGGGAGGSVYDNSVVWDHAITPGTNTGDGSVTITFDVAPPARLSTDSVTFAPQLVGSSSAQELVTITDTGDYPIIFDSVVFGGADPQDFLTSRGSCLTELDPQQSCALVVGFTPTAVGARAATITVSDNEGQDVQTIALAGVGQAPPAAITLSATSVDFGTQTPGVRSPSRFVTVTNSGGQPLTFSALSADGAAPGDFSGDIGTCLHPVAPGASCQLGASFDPTASGSRTATLHFYDNAPGSPQAITLTGVGERPARATLSATSIAFGSQPVGVISAPHLVTITNTGDLPFTFTGIAATGTDPGDFSGVSSCPRTMPAGYSCTFGATFTPTAGGNRTANLVVIDSADATSQVITLTGTGLTRPGAPTIGAATAGNGTATVAFTPPAVTGGSPITGYNIFEGTKSGGEGTTPINTAPLPATARGYTVKGLSNTHTYYFTVQAVNAIGSSASSKEATATPAAPLVVATGSLASGHVGARYSTTLVAIGGLHP